MAILNFTLGPESLGKLHDALVCLGKFSEAVSIEATQDKLVLTALNSSKSAYASFTLIGNKFFSKYQYKPRRDSSRHSEERDKFNCKIYNKALLSVFKGRVVDPSREKDTAVERCEVSVEDGEGKAKSRFVIKIFCKHGVIKTYRLTFEAVAPMHALFVKESANNRWSIASRTLREFVEHFGPGTEQLDIYFEDGRVSLTSYTEKIMSGNEILKQPLHTTITVDTLEFSEFTVEEKLHIVISVKDFKSIITHAGITNTNVKATYSRPSSPFQVTYGEEGVSNEFILMTIGESRGSSSTPMPNGVRGSFKRPASRPPLEATSSSKRVSGGSEMPPPPTGVPPNLSRQSVKRKSSRPSPPPPQPSIQSDALFYPEADDERWDPADFDEDDSEMLLWDSNSKNSAEKSYAGPVIQGLDAQNYNSYGLIGPENQGEPQMSTIPTQLLPSTQRLAPTQRLSNIRGMFDD